MIKEYDEIMIVNGELCLIKDGVGRTYPCPFAYPHPCGTWCPHFGDGSHANGDPRLDYILTLGCCGTLICAKEYHVTNFDETKGSVGVGHPVQQHKEMPVNVVPVDEEDHKCSNCYFGKKVYYNDDKDIPACKCINPKFNSPYVSEDGTCYDWHPKDEMKQ